MNLEWLKTEVEKEIGIISQVFGRAEEKSKTELETFKNKILQDSKTLEQVIKNWIATEEMELKYVKTTLTKKLSSLKIMLNKLEKKEKQNIIKELNRLKEKANKKKIGHIHKKKAIQKINKLQDALQKIKSAQIRKLIEKTKKLTKKEKDILTKKIEEKYKSDTNLLHKDFKELNTMLHKLRAAEKNELQLIKEELQEDIKRVSNLLLKSKTKRKEIKKSAANSLKKIGEFLKSIKVKETRIKEIITHKTKSLQKDLSEFIVGEKKQTLNLINLTLKKLKGAETKTEEEEEGLKKYIKKVFKRLKKEPKTEAQLLKEAALKKLESLERAKLDPKAFDDFTWVLKIFLSNYLGINYEYTHQELITELTRKKTKYKDDIVRLSEEIVRVNYEGDTLDKEHFRKMIEEAKRVINEM